MLAKRVINNIGKETVRMDKIIFDTRKDAQDVLTQLEHLRNTYGYVTIADLNDFIGGATSNLRDYKYGWSNFNRAAILCWRGKYKLYLPEAICIDDLAMCNPESPKESVPDIYIKLRECFTDAEIKTLKIVLLQAEAFMKYGKIYPDDIRQAHQTLMEKFERIEYK
jgi:hypothetical protein